MKEGKTVEGRECTKTYKAAREREEGVQILRIALLGSANKVRK